MSARVITIGIGGPSCSGKTTVTRILQRLLKRSLVIYQDDFFVPDHLIPKDPETQLDNWDCPDALDFARLSITIQYARKHGKLPDDYRSNEVNNTHDGSSQISDAALEALSRRLSCLQDYLFVIVDGFMLYWDERVTAGLDCKIFITASYDTLKRRRENRQGYLTAEGYWQDPPGYFDSIVWPQYIRWNKHLFVGDDHSEVEHEAIDDVLVIDTDKHSIQQTTELAVQNLIDHIYSCVKN